MNKIRIYHGLWRSSCSWTRRGNKYFPMSLKLRKLLQDKAIKFNMDTIEFTYAHIPDLFISVVAIVHPLDFFCRKIGYKIVMDRIIWAKKEVEAGRSIDHKSWAYEFK